MTESEWLLSEDPDPMVRALSAESHQRELRQFALSCARRVWRLLPTSLRATVEVAERFVEGRASVAELNTAGATAQREAQAHWSGGRSPDARAYAESAALDASSEWPRTAANVLAAASCAASAVACAAAEADETRYDQVFESARKKELAVQAALLRGLIDYRAAQAQR